MNSAEIEILEAEDAAAVLGLIEADPIHYRCHFVPFGPGGEKELNRVLAQKQRDKYWKILINGQMAGVFMLRGLDAGFKAPAFGVYIAHRFAGRGLGALALRWAETWCRLNEISECMLSVAEENKRAMDLYRRAGYASGTERTARGHVILRKKLC